MKPMIVMLLTAVLATSETARVPVLLELFTSEGCSSCPPADRLLESLDRQPVAGVNLIVLSEHVDYWNYLGWKDLYSSAVYSDRQHNYADRLGAEVYTPQLIVDGATSALGSDQGEVTQAISRAAKEAKIPVSMSAAKSGTGATVHVDANSRGKSADLYVVIAADRAQSHVLRGENGGHMLTHVAVVQSITKVGKWEGSGATGRDVPIPAKLVAAATSGQTRVIAYLQDPQTGRILGAAQARM